MSDSSRSSSPDSPLSLGEVKSSPESQPSKVSAKSHKRNVILTSKEDVTISASGTRQVSLSNSSPSKKDLKIKKPLPPQRSSQ